MSLDDKIKSNETTKLYDGVCAYGIVDPILNKPLWNQHPYKKPNEQWTEIYCPKHKDIADRIIQQRKLDEMDGIK